MAKQQTPEQHAAFQQLCRENGLDPRADVWQQKQSGQWIIGRTGIEKIQARNHISVTLDVVGFGLDYAGVKATATRSVKEEGARTAKKLVMESLGSAHPKNCLRISYYLEMAEKRAKSRAVLMLMGFYALGVYGEDEADDFKQPAEVAQLPAPTPTPQPQEPGNAGGGSPTPSGPPVMRASSNSAAPVASTGAAPSTQTPAERQDEIVAETRTKLLTATSTAELKDLYSGLIASLRSELQDDFTAAKLRIQASVAQDSATPAPRHTGPAAAAAESGNLKQAGTDAALVQDFADQPTMPSGTFAPATKEQKEELIRLTNHPLITRKEKTLALLNSPRYDTERARQLLVKLRGAIAEREGCAPTQAEQVGEVRANILLLLKQDVDKLGIQQEADLRAVLADARAPLAALEQALSDARDAVLDAETYGTEGELAAVEAAAAA